MSRAIHIVGAGPAGLAAAIVAAKAGARVIVHERKAAVGTRFHGDFQGLENWTIRGDVLDELARYDIAPDCERTPFREALFFDAEGREYPCRSPAPLFYLVRRGPQPGTLDSGLVAQAQALGVRVRFGRAVRHLPRGGIVAAGPLRAPAIAVGMVFDTDSADGAYAVAADALAPKGYAYLLVHRGRGTLATCIFADFHHEQRYLEASVDFFRRRVGVRIRNARRFAGFANAFALPSARKDGILYAGESAGFQDALFGFGMRYALLSGALAAQAVLAGDPQRYDRACRRRLQGLLRAGLVNRFLYERLGDPGYARFAARVARARDARDYLRRRYAPAPWKTLVYHLVRRSLQERIAAPLAMMEHCDCTWCRCARMPRHEHPCAA